MTPKAPGRVRMSKIIRVSSPAHLQLGKDVAIVDGQHRSGGPLNVRRRGLRQLRVGGSVERLDRLRYSFCSLLAGLVLRLEHFSTCFFYEGQSYGNPTELHLAVECPLREFKCVRRPVVAVD